MHRSKIPGVRGGSFVQWEEGLGRGSGEGDHRPFLSLLDQGHLERAENLRSIVFRVPKLMLLHATEYLTVLRFVYPV